VPAASQSALFQKLPSTDELLRQSAIQALIESEGHTAVAASVRIVLARIRQEIANGHLDDESLDLALGGLSEAVERQLRQSLSYSLLPLINATGVILHTNLGRAPLAAAALDHIRETARRLLQSRIQSGNRRARQARRPRRSAYFKSCWPRRILNVWDGRLARPSGAKLRGHLDHRRQ
jgi:arginine repressor